MNALDKSKLWIGLAYALLLLTFGYNFFSYFSHQIVGGMEVLTNSDSMYMATVYDNLVNQSGAYKNWYLAPAPYFFPDMTLYFISNFFGGYFYYANFIFINLQLLVVFCFVKKINGVFLNRDMALLLSAVSVAFLYVVTLNFTPYLIRSSHHFGAFLSGLIFIYLLLKLIESPKLKPGYALSLVILVTLIVMSDKLFLLQFMAPAVVALIVLSMLQKISWLKLLKLLLLLVAGIAIGLYLYSLAMVHITAYEVTYGWDNIKTNLMPLVGLFLRTFKSNYFYTAVFGIFYLLCHYLVVSYLWCLMHKRKYLAIDTSSRLFLVLFLVFMLSGITLVLVSSSLTMMPRFILPIYFLPVCLLPVVISFLIKTEHLKFNFTKMAWIAMFLMVASYTVIQARHFEFKADYYPKPIQCFDDFVLETGAKRGISGYWESKNITMLSKQAVTVAQTNDIFDPYLWISTTEWYANSYDFVVAQARNQAEIKGHLDHAVNRIGLTPTKVYQCKPYVIFYYQDGFTLDNHNQF